MFKTLKLSIIAATILTTLGFIMGIFFSKLSVHLFTTDEELIGIASKALKIVILMFPIVGFQIVIGNFFQSIGKAKISIFLSLTRQLIFLVPSLLILPYFMGLDGAWAAFPVADALAAFVAAVTLLSFHKRFRQL